MASNSAPRSEGTLHDLAARSRRGDAEAAAEFRRRMNSSLGPIVRLAMRRGEGPPRVVSWVRRAAATMADGRRVPPQQFASDIAELLCSELLRSPPGDAHAQRGGADTTVGA
jgi:hypothetical protein